MFSKNREVIPESFSKDVMFDLLERIGLNQDRLVALDVNLNAHGLYTITEVVSVTVLGSNTLSISTKNNDGSGVFQINKIDRLKSIEIMYMPLLATGSGTIKPIMRFDISEPEIPEEVAEVKKEEGSIPDDQTGPN